MGSNYAGVDWASEKHDLLVADETGEAILAATFAHDERGLIALCNALVRLKVQLVAIERPDGLLIERLLDAGLRVMAIHPNQVAAARPAVSRRRREIGSVRRVRALRARADRQPPLPGAGPGRRSDQGAAGADPCAGGSRRAPGSRSRTSSAPNSSAIGRARR